MQDKHTPGPWLISKCKRKVYWLPKEKWMPGHVVAVTGEVPMDREQREANARLIAAAPALLAAARIALDFLVSSEPGYEELKAAIEKATL